MTRFGIPSSIIDAELNRSDDPNEKYMALIEHCTHLVKVTAKLIEIQHNPRVQGAEIMDALRDFKKEASHVVFHLALLFTIFQFSDGDMMQGIYMYLADKNQNIQPYTSEPLNQKDDGSCSESPLK